MFCRSEIAAPTVEQAAKSPAAATARQSIAGTGSCPGEGVAPDGSSDRSVIGPCLLAVDRAVTVLMRSGLDV
jgi:hypothetical protein